MLFLSYVVIVSRSDAGIVFTIFTTFSVCFSVNLKSFTTALSLMKFCMNVYFDNRKNLVEFQGCRSEISVIELDFWIPYHCEIQLCRYWLLLNS